MLRSGLCEYNDPHILVKGTITVAKETAAAPNNANKKVMFKKWASIANWISRRKNNKQIDDAHDNDVVMRMCLLKEYSDNYAKKILNFIAVL